MQFHVIKCFKFFLYSKVFQFSLVVQCLMATFKVLTLDIHTSTWFNIKSNVHHMIEFQSVNKQGMTSSQRPCCFSYIYTFLFEVVGLVIIIIIRQFQNLIILCVFGVSTHYFSCEFVKKRENMCCWYEFKLESLILVDDSMWQKCRL